MCVGCGFDDEVPVTSTVKTAKNELDHRHGVHASHCPGGFFDRIVWPDLEAFERLLRDVHISAESLTLTNGRFTVVVEAQPVSEGIVDVMLRFARGKRHFPNECKRFTLTFVSEGSKRNITSDEFGRSVNLGQILEGDYTFRLFRS